MHIHRLCALVLAAIAAAACGSSVRLPDGATAEEAKAIADAVLEEKDYPRAARHYEAVRDGYPRTPEADAAQWLAAEAWFLAGELKTAQRYYEEYFESHPLTNLGVLGERMYSIGVERYERGRGGFIGLGVFPTSENGLKALQWITQKLPNGTRADDAFFFIGKARMTAYDYDEAVLNLDQILSRYPQSEWTHEARFLRGLSYLLMNRGPPYDRDSLLKARRDLAEYIRVVERSEALRTEYADRLGEAKTHHREIEERLARKSVLVADFYQAEERWAAERLYLEEARKRFPDTEAGREAAARLAAPAAEGE